MDTPSSSIAACCSKPFFGSSAWPETYEQMLSPAEIGSLNAPVVNWRVYNQKD